MKTEEGTYQKLVNEDTLSTISFRPLAPPKKRYCKDDCSFRKFIVAVIAVFIVGLLLGHFFVGYQIFKSLSKSPNHPHTRWSTFLEDGYEPPQASKTSCKDLPYTKNDVDADYEDSVAAGLHKALSQGPIPSGYENGKMQQIITGYRACNKGMDNHDVNELMDTVLENILTSNSKESIAEAAALMLAHFNLETFFKFEVLANFVEPDGDEPTLVYLSPNPDFARPPVQMDLTEFKDLTLRGRRVFEPALSFALALGQLAETNDNSSKWQILSLDPANNEAFDFGTFFKTLFMDQHIPLEKFKFVVTNPAYVQKLGELLDSTSAQTIKGLIAANLRKSLKEDFDDCVKVVEKYTPHAATVMYLSTLNTTEVKQLREAALKMFELLSDKVTDIIDPYLSSEEQRKAAKERITKVGVSTEEPEWMLLANNHKRFDVEHEKFSIHSEVPSIVALLRFRRFAMLQQLRRLTSKSEALRNSKFEATAQSITQLSYSVIGNWINIPVAAFMRLHKSNEVSFILDMAKVIVQIVTPEGFHWSPYGSQRHRPSQALVPADLVGQQQCFAIHGVANESLTTPLAMEASYQALLDVDKTLFADVNLLWDLVHVVTSKKDDLSNIVLSAGFLEYHGVKVCEEKNVLPCFI